MTGFHCFLLKGYWLGGSVKQLPCWIQTAVSFPVVCSCCNPCSVLMVSNGCFTNRFPVVWSTLSLRDLLMREWWGPPSLGFHWLEGVLGTGAFITLQTLASAPFCFKSVFPSAGVIVVHMGTWAKHTLGSGKLGTRCSTLIRSGIWHIIGLSDLSRSLWMLSSWARLFFHLF